MKEREQFGANIITSVECFEVGDDISISTGREADALEETVFVIQATVSKITDRAIRITHPSGGNCWIPKTALAPSAFGYVTLRSWFAGDESQRAFIDRSTETVKKETNDLPDSRSSKRRRR